MLTVFSTSLNAAAPSQAKSSPDKALVRADFLKDINADFAKMGIPITMGATAAEVEAWQRGNAMREVLARNQQLFRDLDKNHNGQLSEVEFGKFRFAQLTVMILVEIAKKLLVARQNLTHRVATLPRLDFRGGQLPS